MFLLGLKAKKYAKFSVVIPGDAPSPFTSKANRRRITAAVELSSTGSFLITAQRTIAIGSYGNQAFIPCIINSGRIV